MPRPPLPSLVALRALEAAVRHGGVVRAAAELGVTHGAVSRHLRDLEQALGVELVVRGARRLDPTYEGRRLGAALTPLFDGMAAAVESVRRRPERESLRVSVDPAFAGLWLLPRLGAFRRPRPGVEVVVDAATHLADVAAGPVDVAVRHLVHRRPEADGCRFEKLADALCFPAAAPALAATLGPAATAADIARLPLIHDDGREPWHLWLKAAGVAPPPDRGALLLNDLTLAVLAAERGEGAVLLDTVLGAEALAAGRLVALSPLTVRIGTYWLVTPAARPLGRPAREFADWLRAGLGGGEGGA